MKLFSTSCEALYLGWDAPLLPRSVAVLSERFQKNQIWNLGQLICVLPSTRAAGRFGDLVQWHAEDQDWTLHRPEVITVGQLPEMLYRPQVPAALEFEQTLAWAKVLRAASPGSLAPLVSAAPPPDPIGPWLELASTLRRLHEELSADRLNFRDVVEAAETDSEKRRWKLLCRLFDQYRESIESAGLADPHWVRQMAVSSGKVCCDKTVVLVGTSDLSPAVIAMLRALDSDLMAMVAAPPSEAFRFDEFGCVDTTYWLDHSLPLRDEQLVAAGDIADQATAVAESIADYASSYSADQVTVGVTDESHVGPLEIELRGCGVSTHRQLGWTVAETAIGRLMTLTAAYLQRRTWRTLAALVRHADVHRYLTGAIGNEVGSDSGPDWLTQLDRLLANHYPIHTAEPVTSAAAQAYPLAVAAKEQVDRWLAVFSSEEKTIAQWSREIDRWLQTLQFPDDGTADRTVRSMESVRRLLERFADLKDELDLRLSGGAAIETISGRLSDVRVAQTAHPEDVDILGWLDLTLDDAPAMVVMGLNHPFVPAATTSDPFLPGTLRTRLRMGDNDRRYARDVYAMQLMLSCRDDIRFVVGKTAADRSPTPPSRLLAAADRTDSARRIRQLLSEQRPRVVVDHRWDVGDQTELPIPKLPATDSDTKSPFAPDPPATSRKECPVSSLSVTAFRDYLTCPYRFYLRHVLKLKPLDDSESELAANQFGDLVHGSLERFGQSEQRHETDPATIESLLLEHLDQYADENYGAGASTAVAIQVAQARRRLKTVALRQAERIADGWKIHATEASVGAKEKAGIRVDGQWMGLKGRFDRIDRHRDGRWAILDYKTHGHRPEKKHLRKTEDGVEWIDLQLPLYRMMIPFLGIDVPPKEVQLGYFNVAEKSEETRINIAEFSEVDMTKAEGVIEQCVRGIFSCDFTPTTDRVQFDDYGMILQTGVANRLLDQAEALLDEVEA